MDSQCIGLPPAHQLSAFGDLSFDDGPLSQQHCYKNGDELREIDDDDEAQPLAEPLSHSQQEHCIKNGDELREVDEAQPVAEPLSQQHRYKNGDELRETVDEAQQPTADIQVCLESRGRMSRKRKRSMCDRQKRSRSHSPDDMREADERIRLMQEYIG